MSHKRILSKETSIYHRPWCRYVKRIQYKNRMEVLMPEAKSQGYRPCKCCNTMKHLFETEHSSIAGYGKNMGMEFNFKDGILYVKTAIGCWKLVYSKKAERVVLYHRNRSRQPLDFANPERERYHRQDDCSTAGSISTLLQYIYEHDRYREAQEKGVELTTFTSKRSRILAGRMKKKEQHRRIDRLFALLEENNKDYRKLSCC